VARRLFRALGLSLNSLRSDNLPTDLVPAADNLEATVHLSVLAGSQMLDVYRCPDPSRCPFPCTKSNRRYHCPLCDNKPQKPGRMRRHFFTMHAGKHVIEHEGELIGLIESLSYEWEVGTVRFVPCGDRAVSKHSDWLSDDFARSDWSNRCLRGNSVP